MYHRAIVMVPLQMLKLSARRNYGGKHVYYLYLIIIERLIIVCKILYCIFSQTKTSTAKSVLIIMIINAIIIILIIFIDIQHAKKVASDGSGLVDFAIRLVIFVLNLPDEQVLFFWGNSNYRRIVINPTYQKGFWG